MNKKLILFYFILSLAGNKSFSQQAYLNKKFNLNVYENGFSILPADSGYNLISAQSDSNYNILKIAFIRMDFSGNVISNKLLDASPRSYLAGWYGGLIQDDSKLFMTGSSSIGNGDLNVILYKFNQLGDTILTRIYPDSAVQDGNHLIKTRTGEFIVAGETRYYDQYGDFMLMKLDSNYNLLWQKHYPGNSIDDLHGGDTTMDGNYIFAGKTLSYGPGASPGCFNMYVFKTDTAGNMLWGKYFGGPYSDYANAVIQCRDGSIAIGGVYSVHDNTGTNICNEGFSQPWILKLDQQGNVIWERKYGDAIFSTEIWSMRETANGDLIAAGIIGGDSLGSLDGLILRVRSNGDSVFYRSYQYQQGPYSLNLLQDIAPDIDGGFIACGTMKANPPDTGLQDTWILKVDSMGCEQLNCSLGSIISETGTDNHSIRLYPNPFQDVVYIENNSGYAIKETEVFDVLSREVIHQKGTVTALHLENFPPGNYFYRIKTEDDKWYSGRMVRN